MSFKRTLLYTSNYVNFILFAPGGAYCRHARRSTRPVLHHTFRYTFIHYRRGSLSAIKWSDLAVCWLVANLSTAPKLCYNSVSSPAQFLCNGIAWPLCDSLISWRTITVISHWNTHPISPISPCNVEWRKASKLFVQCVLVSKQHRKMGLGGRTVKTSICQWLWLL